MTTNDSQLPAAAATTPAGGQESAEPFAIWHVIRLSTFQIGSAMGDILVTSIWNRIMISNFGIPRNTYPTQLNFVRLAKAIRGTYHFQTYLLTRGATRGGGPVLQPGT